MTVASLSRSPIRFPYVPGLLLTVAIAMIAEWLHLVPVLAAFSPAIIAALLGLAIRHALPIPPAADEGIALSTKTLLRIAVALLGLQVTVGQVLSLGWRGLGIAVAGLSCSFLFIRWLGARLGVEQKLATLIAAGVSVCGASAVAGVNAVTDAEDEDAAYAVALVTVFGTLALLVYPALNHVIGMTPRNFGLWTGASIHEVAQVAGAAAQAGPEAEQYGAITKLTRVMLLAPLVLALRLGQKGESRKTVQAGIPVFVAGFIALMCLSSLVAIPLPVKAAMGQTSAFLLAMALGGMGLKTHIADLKAKGWRPFALGAAGSLFISLFTLGLVSILG